MKDIKYIKGVGEARAKALAKFGIATTFDMLFHFPRKMEDRSVIVNIADVIDGETVSINAVVYSAVSERKVRGMTITTATLRDESGVLHATWFNNKYIKNILKTGENYLFYGKVSNKYGKKEMATPIFEKINESVTLGRIVPIYPLTANLSQKVISKIMLECLDYSLDEFPETLPNWMRKEYELCEIKYALKSIHFPPTMHDWEIARKRLVFDEFLTLQLGLRQLLKEKENLTGTCLKTTDYSDFEKTLPFPLTNAQKRAINEIASDLTRKTAMNRLVQGDVGCGKTVVAATSLFLAVKNGYQGAMMAPTEILANQHFKTLSEMFEPLGISICLLSGSMTKKERAPILENIKNGTAQIIVGTHAILEDTVEFANLALAITDEQHRFGVRQRGTFAKKGVSPHVLVMTATPIPRTLALIVYGDLDVSIIDELPPGRTPISTYSVTEDMRQRIYAFIEKEISSGHQAYIVCPIVLENESDELKSVQGFAQTLQTEIFPKTKIEFLHGKMKPKEKDRIMQSFVDGETKILVSTTVIEVGVNVPNATLMIIENAERFGLSQLHQLRGRVGRGGDKSYCILMSNSEGEVAKMRMDVMESTTDGFVIAEKDLEIRGPGEFFGTRQHGLPELKIGNLFTDIEILKQAGEATNKLIQMDPELKKDEHRLLREKIKKMFEENDPTRL